MDFEDERSSNDTINNATMSDDEVVASYGPPRSLLDAFSHLYKAHTFASARTHTSASA